MAHHRSRPTPSRTLRRPPADRSRGSFYRRCGLPYGQPPRATAELRSCPVCYRTVADDGRLPSLDQPGIRIGRRSAPFDTVRRYLVTGQVEAGRNRALAHDAIVTAMTQLDRWGPDCDVSGDLPDWKAAREAVVVVMERYAAGRA